MNQISWRQDANFSEMPKISGGITCKPNYQTNTETDFSIEDQIRIVLLWQKFYLSMTLRCIMSFLKLKKTDDEKV